MKGSEQDAQPPSSISTAENNKMVLDAIASMKVDIIRDMNFIKQEICTTIDARITEVSSTLRAEFASQQTLTEAAIATLQTSVDSHGTTLTELEKGATYTSDLTANLHKEVSRLSSLVKTLEGKCESLEGHSRRNNVRIIGIPEGKEGPNVKNFVAELLKDLLALQNSPLLDRAHRSLQSRPGPGEPSRAIILKCHYHHECEEILRRAREMKIPLTHQGMRLHVFPDYTPSVSKKRASFTDVRRTLRGMSGAKYGFIYPARLRVTLPGHEERRFTDAKEAMDYINRASTP